LIVKEARMNFDKEKDDEQALNIPYYGRSYGLGRGHGRSLNELLPFR